MTDPVRRFTVDFWHFAVKPASPWGGDYVAWAQRTPTTANSPLFEPSGIDVWFEIGPTEAEAIERLRATLPSP